MAKRIDKTVNPLKKQPANRIGRLVNIIVLLGFNNLTAEKLSDKLKVSKRTIYRDIEALNAWGLKIKSSTGEGGGYQLPRAIKLSLSSLTESEISFLGAGALAIKNFLDLHDDVYNFDLAREKISTNLPPKTRSVFEKLNQCIYFDQSRWYKKYEFSKHLKIMRDAVMGNYKIQISYNDTNGTLKQDEISPYGLVFKSDTWYLVGFSSLSTIIKRWNITRIKDSKILEEKLTVPENFVLSEWWEKQVEDFGKGNIPVKLKIAKNSLHRFSRFQWKSTNVFYETDDYILVDLFVDKFDWLIDIILINQGNVIVLEPADLRNRIQQISSQININHSFSDINQTGIERKINLSDLEAISLSTSPEDEK
jgi:predicted DNA-binding transcriptional regulator YafY